MIAAVGRVVVECLMLPWLLLRSRRLAVCSLISLIVVILLLSGTPTFKSDDWQLLSHVMLSGGELVQLFTRRAPPSYTIDVVQELDDSIISTKFAYSANIVDDNRLIVQEDDFCIIPNVMSGQINETLRISLLLHASSDRVGDKLVEHATNWDGPISVAYAWPEGTDLSGQEVQCALDKLDKLARDHEDIKQKMSIHFLVKRPIECNDQYLRARDKQSQNPPHSRSSCLKKSLPKLSDTQLAQQFVQYPINKARNTARKYSNTKYILSADFEHLFSARFESLMLELAERVLPISPHLVLTYRIFEIADSRPGYSIDRHQVKMPKNVADLKDLMLNGDAFIFHDCYYRGAHAIPRLGEWFNHTDSERAEIQYVQKYTSTEWEPQFVSLTDIPLHDEQFLYPLNDNTCQRWELCFAGYSFAIVHNAFMYHRGVKTSSNSKATRAAHSLASKQRSRILKQFRQRMNNQYGVNNTNKCPLP